MHGASWLKSRPRTLSLPRVAASFPGRFASPPPVSLGTLHLGRALFPLLREHPGIQLTLDLDDKLVDVLGDGYDAVIRHSRP